MSGIHRAIRTWTRTVNLYYTLTEFSRQKFIQGGLPGDRIAIKQNFVQPDPLPGKGDGGYVIFAGRLSHEKGIDTMLAAWSRMQEPRPMLKIVGDGPMAHRVREAALHDPAIQWLGYRSLGEVLNLIGAATCLIMPSIWYETFGRTIIEAFAKGTPVVASRLGAMGELVEHGRTGLHFEPGDSDDLAAKMRQLLGDAPMRARMRRACREEYEAKYTAETNYRVLMNIYERALKLSSACAAAVN
jgi:glycosyltransferase involved in cell wall biosynthesis